MLHVVLLEHRVSFSKYGRTLVLNLKSYLLHLLIQQSKAVLFCNGENLSYFELNANVSMLTYLQWLCSCKLFEWDNFKALSFEMCPFWRERACFQSVSERTIFLLTFVVLVVIVKVMLLSTVCFVFIITSLFLSTTTWKHVDPLPYPILPLMSVPCCTKLSKAV